MIYKNSKLAVFTILLVILSINGCDKGEKKVTTEADKAPTEAIEKDLSSRPNILIILADDMGFGDIGAFGSEIKTPNIDELAKQGTQFTNFHVGAACSPTRTMLMTGVDNHLAGLGNMHEIQADNQFDKPGYEGHLNNTVVSVATLLKDGGYHTYMAGKWHLGSSKENIPHGRGFERSFALMESGADNWQQQPYVPTYDAVHYYENDKEVQLPTEGYFSTNAYTDKIIGWIDENHEDAKPFFAFVSYQAMHYPHQAPKEFIDKYNGVYDQGWEVLREKRFKRQKELGIISSEVTLAKQFDKTTYKPWQIPDWDAQTEEDKQFSARKMQTYAGMLDNMDVNIGRLLTHLEEIGETDNTLIIFLSDNGADPNELPQSPDFRAWYESNYTYVYKDDYKGDYTAMGQKGSFADFGPGWAAASVVPGSYYKTFSSEGGIRVPFIAKLPGSISAGKTTNEFGFVKDIVPTMLEVAGINVPDTSYKGKTINPPTGISMWPALTGKSEKIHNDSEYIGYELAGSSAIFQGDLKLSQNLPPKGTGEWELYNTKLDPSEVNNLAMQQPKKVEELIQAYANYEKANGVIPVPDGYNPITQIIKNSKRK